MNVEASERAAPATLATFVRSNLTRFRPELQEFVRIPKRQRGS